MSKMISNGYELPYRVDIQIARVLQVVAHHDSRGGR